jgi:hypothetical protein
MNKEVIKIDHYDEEQNAYKATTDRYVLNGVIILEVRNNNTMSVTGEYLKLDYIDYKVVKVVHDPINLITEYTIGNDN